MQLLISNLQLLSLPELLQELFISYQLLLCNMPQLPLILHRTQLQIFLQFVQVLLLLQLYQVRSICLALDHLLLQLLQTLQLHGQLLVLLQSLLLQQLVLQLFCILLLVRYCFQVSLVLLLFPRLQHLLHSLLSCKLKSCQLFLFFLPLHLHLLLLLLPLDVAYQVVQLFFSQLSKLLQIFNHC